MRLILCLLAMVVAAAPARAQSWQDYTYPAYSFGIALPAAPKIETTTYPAPDGRAAQARVFSLAWDDAVFRMTVVELPGMEENAVVGQAIKTLAQDAEIKLDIPARVSRVFGRQLSLAGADGTRSSVAVFYHLGRLYQIEGKALSREATSSAIRFQQSLVFTGGETNRPDAVREARRNCRNAAESGGAAAAANDGSPRDDERCRRRAR